MRIGAYEVVRELGRGGMGVVLAARAPDGRPVAIKVLRNASSADAAARFDRERRLLEALGEAEGFVPLLDAGTGPHGPFIVMPYLGGGTLRDRLRQGPLPLEEALALGGKLARALGAAHVAGIVHRDLKPENVIFSSTGAPLVADLGLAKHWATDAPGMSRSVQLSKTGEMRGTFGYMAPEQTQSAKDAGPPADVFAVGAILFECLTGRAAFEGASLQELVAAVCFGKRPNLRADLPHAPRWVDRLIQGALAIEPAERFADGGALARAIEAGPAGTMELPGPSSRGRGKVLGLAAVVLLLLGLIVVLARGAPGPTAIDPAAAVSSSVGPVGSDAASKTAKEVPVTVASLVSTARARLAAGDPSGALDAAGRALEMDKRSALALAAKGEALRRRGDASARALLDRAIFVDPQLAVAWNDRGCLRLDAQDLDGALLDLDRAIHLDDSVAAYWVNRARVHRLRRSYDAGIADATRAIQLSPDLATAHEVLGIVYVEKGELERAIPELDRAIALDPKLGGALGTRADLRRLRGDLAGATADLDSATVVTPDDPGVFINRGLLRRDSGDLEGASKDLVRAMELAPKKASARTHYADLLRRQRKLDKALAEIEVALDLDPLDPLAWSTRSAIRDEARDPVRALEDANHAVELGPRSAYAHQARADALLALGRHEDALAEAQKVLALDPRSPNAHVTIALVNQQKAPDQALESANKALELSGGREVNAWIARCCVRLQKQQWAEAVADATSCIQRDPAQGIGYFMRGVAKSRLKDDEGALADLEVAVVNDPNLVEALKVRAKHRALAGKKKEAAEDYELYLKKMPGDPEAAALREKIRLLKEER